MRRLERNGGFTLAPGANCLRFRPLEVSAASTAVAQSQRLGAPGFTFFATLRLVLELFIVKEELLTSGKNEVSAAVYALENLILELH